VPVAIEFAFLAALRQSKQEIAAVEIPPAVNRGPPISSFGQMPWLVAKFCVSAMNASSAHPNGMNTLRMFKPRSAMSLGA